MTDEKICPFMSRGTIQNDGDHLLATIYCQGERCKAWVPECPRLNAADRECETEDCIAMDRGFSECKGGCRLI